MVLRLREPWLNPAAALEHVTQGAAAREEVEAGLEPAAGGLIGDLQGWIWPTGCLADTTLQVWFSFGRVGH